MAKKADVVIIGGGIVGTSITCHLSSGGVRSIVLLEKEPLLGTGSSSASAGIIYHHLPEKVNLQLSQRSLRAVLEFEDEFDTKVDFRRCGCIQTAAKPEDLAAVSRDLYDKFRPEIPRGRRGWGAKGELDLDYIRSLAETED